MKKKVLSKLAVILGLSLLVVGLIGCGSGPSDPDSVSSSPTVSSPNPDKEFTAEPQEKTVEGFYVYYIQYARFNQSKKGYDLLFQTANEDYVRVVGLQENLTVSVCELCTGTVLVAKHWQYNVINYVDDAELIVRTQEQKEIWEEAIREQGEIWERAAQEWLGRLQQPRDVLPPRYGSPKSDLGSTVPSTYLGISAFNYGDEAQGVSGVIVTKVREGGPAEGASLLVEDVIISLDGEKTETFSKLQDMLFRHKPGDKVTLTVLRGITEAVEDIEDGEEVEIVVILGTRPK